MTTTQNPNQPRTIGTASGHTVTIWPASTYSAERAEVQVQLPDSPERRMTIDVYGPDSMFGASREARINWSAIGSVSAADAAAYGRALEVAAEISKTLKPETGPQS